MQIFVKTFTGDTITVESAPTDTIEALKNAIYDEEGIPLEYQRLIFADNELEDHKCLCNYKIENQSTIHIIPRLVGGFIERDLETLAMKHTLIKNICRKCYGRLPVGATRCRKVKCGRTTDIRCKKMLYHSSNKTVYTVANTRYYSSKNINLE